MSLRSRVMGLGLRLLNRLAGSRALDDTQRRRRVARWLYGASHAGFAAAGAANRPFKAAQKLLRPQRPVRAAHGDLFDLTPGDDQSMVRESMQRFAADVLRPAAAAADEAGAAPAPIRAQADELGIVAMNVAEDLGGVASERSAVTNVLIHEALAHGDMGLAAALLSGPAVATALANHGSAEQQAQYLPSLLAASPAPAAIALMECGPLFNPLALKTRAVRTPQGFRLDGEKHLVIGGAGAELFIVAALGEGDAPALFVVESGTAGISSAPQPSMGLRAANLARVRFDGVALPASACLGGDEAADYREFIALSRLAWCSLALGTMQAVLDYVVPYANDRVAFGEPISHRQGVAFMISNIAIELDGLRLATWRAASRADAGRSFVREAALARSLCSRHAMRAGSDGVQILGGHGYVREHPVERWYRDLRGAGLMEGGLLV